jgi:hypothetical protein
MVHECMHDTCNYEHCTWLNVPKLLSQMVVLQLSLTKYSMEKWCKDLMEFETHNHNLHETNLLILV